MSLLLLVNKSSTQLSAMSSSQAPVHLLTIYLLTVFLPVYLLIRRRSEKTHITTFSNINSDGHKTNFRSLIQQNEPHHEVNWMNYIVAYKNIYNHNLFLL